MTVPAILLEASLRTSLLGIGVWVLLRLLGVRRAALERRVWNAVLVLAVLMPAATMLVPHQWPTAYSRWTIALPPAVDASLVGTTGTMAFDWRFALTGYALVAFVLVARLAAGLVAIRKLWRDATPIDVQPAHGVPVRTSARVQSPMAIGQGIVLPRAWEQWNTTTLARVMAHEESHVARGDFWWQLLARLYQALFWINPLSAWLVRHLSLLAERQSDDEALRLHGDPADYAEMLVAFAARDAHASARLVGVRIAPQDELAQRVEAILRWHDESGDELAVRRRHRALGVLAGLVMAAAMLLSPTVRMPTGRPDANFGRLAPLGPMAPMTPMVP